MYLSHTKVDRDEREKELISSLKAASQFTLAGRLMVPPPRRRFSGRVLDPPESPPPDVLPPELLDSRVSYSPPPLGLRCALCRFVRLLYLMWKNEAGLRGGKTRYIFRQFRI